MKTFHRYFNANGLTLIELLGSIVIIGIIFASFFTFFSQSMLFSTKVEDKFSGANIAERIIFEADRDLTKQDLDAAAQSYFETPMLSLSNTQLSKIKKLVPDSTGNYYYSLNDKKYYPEITICQIKGEEDLLGLYRINVKIFDKELGQEKRTLLSESSNYLSRQEK
jgi:type II secretory pathway pseudopilin PulG